MLRRAVDIERYTQGEMTTYKWEVGVKILEEFTFINEEGVAPQIMGLDVDINYKNQEAIRLWKEVRA